MTRLRRIAIAGALAGGGLLGAAPASAAPSAHAAMYVEIGPFSTYDGCEISRHLDDHATSPCTLDLIKWPRFGWFYGWTY